MTNSQDTRAESERTLLLTAGELPEAAVAAAMEHARSCASCRDLVEALHDVEGAYASARGPRLRAHETEAMLQQVFDSTASLRTITPGGGGHAARHRRAWRMALGVATAASVVLASGVVLKTRTSGPAALSPALGRVEPTAPSAFVRLAALDAFVQAANPDELDARLLDFFEVESSPNVRLAILDALDEATIVTDPRVLRLIAQESLAPLRIDLLVLAARHRIPGTAAVTAGLASGDGSASVRAVASSILSEI